MIKIGLLTLLLSACMIATEPQIRPQYGDKSLPKFWQASGKMSIKTPHKLENAHFEIEVKEQNFILILTTAFGFGQVIIEPHTQGLLVNNKVFAGDFKTWMLQKYGWYFPLQNLTPLLFTPNPSPPKNWQISISSPPQINPTAHPKIIRFNHLHQSVKIKLAFTHIDILTP